MLAAHKDVKGRGVVVMLHVAECVAVLIAPKNGLAIVRASRVGNGIVNRIPSDNENQFIAADSLNPVKARILLALALTQTSDPKVIQSYFDQY